MRKFIALLTAVLLLIMPLYASAEEGSTAIQEKNSSLRLLKHLYRNQNTLVFSPLSLTVALSMATEGASGETLSQLDSFLGDKRPSPMVLEDLSFSGVSIANAAFVRPEFTLLTDYQETLSDKYEAAPAPMENGNVMNQVNNWVSDHTDGLIDALLDSEPSPETVLLLISALSMNAEWALPFNPANTGFAVFHAPAGDIEVSSMRQTDAFLYGETDGVQSISLPYKNSAPEMIVLLPEDGNLQPLVDELSASPDQFIEKYQPTENMLVQLSLPNVHAESSFELKDALLASGVSDAFDPSIADFSQMAENALELDLHIGSVLQKAVLKVNEAGTEAAAVTQVAMLARGAYIGKSAVMNVDRPFMMLIRDPASGYVLFASCINNPS